MNLSAKLHESALINKDYVAFYFLGQQKTYAELDHAVTRFASGLSELGIRKGDHIALVVGNSPHFLIGFYGALRVGATVIPINPMYTSDEITYILLNGDVKAVITLDVLVPLMDGIVGKLPNISRFIICESGKVQIEESVSAFKIQEKLVDFENVFQLGREFWEGPVLQEDDVAVILYTSGTTGKPKGAMLTHRNVYSNARDVGDYLKFTSEDIVIATLPMFHVFGLTVAINATLMKGASIAIVPRFSSSDVFQIAKQYGATVFVGVPTMYNFLLQHEGDVNDFKTIRLAISGGASMPVALLHSFEKKFNVTVFEGYGLSEAAPVTCFNSVDRPRKLGSIGTSIVNVENKVVNLRGEEVPVGEVGELIVRGPNVMKGYYNMPEETASALKDGWLYTGDLAQMDDDGYFYIVDRKKDMINVGGYNVYPREVEEVLFAHNNILEVAVVGVPDVNLGEAVHAYIVPKEDSLTEEDIRDYCTQHLVKYKIPTVIVFMDELPKNTTGKILRRSLKQSIK